MDKYRGSNMDNISNYKSLENSAKSLFDRIKRLSNTNEEMITFTVGYKHDESKYTLLTEQLRDIIRYLEEKKLNKNIKITSINSYLLLLLKFARHAKKPFKEIERLSLTKIWITGFDCRRLTKKECITLKKNTE